MSHTIRSVLWLSFFGGILVAWVALYQMATGMGLDWIGRMTMPMEMGMDMSMEDDMDMADMDGDAMPMGDGAMPMDDDAMPAGDDAMPMDDDAMPMDGDMAASDDAMPMDMDMGMDGMEMGDMDMMGMDMSAMTRFAPLFGMWSIMMAAMMLPTLIPTLLTYEKLMVSADGTRAGWLGVLGGYSIVWVGVAAAFAVVQIGLLNTGVIDMMGVAQSTWIAGGLLIVVGAFQFTRAKEVCHGVCHAPMNYFLGHWKTGANGGLRMGLGLGAFCAGCCWGFMALGFVGGMMSLLWMGLATLFMVIEKLPEIGHYVTKPMGVLLILGGVGVCAYPYLAA